MNQTFNRIRVWAEQGNVTIPQLFFQFYKQLAITDEEAMMMLHLLAFHEEGIDFPTPAQFEQRTHLTQNAIAQLLQRLMHKGMLELKQHTDESGKIYEKYSLYPLWERILDKMESATIVEQQKQQKLDDRAVFQLFEQELGRLLSPIEIETITMWLDVDRHTPEIIKAALKEAVLAGKVSLRYIDRILIEWKKKNITSMQQIEKHAEQYRQNTMNVRQSTPPVQQKKPSASFYNWLEERE